MPSATHRVNRSPGSEKPGHQTWNDLEDWRKDNEHIQTGYLRLNDSWRRSWLSLFGPAHNETVNILTHLLGAVVAIGVLIYPYRHIHIPFFGPHPIREAFSSTLYLIHPLPGGAVKSVTWADTVAFACFYLSATICFGCSATFHTSLSHSEVRLAANRTTGS